MKEQKMNLGAMAFVLGLIIAIVAGIFMPGNGMAVLLLGVIGIIVGLLNITDKEVMLYLVATIAFIVAGTGLTNLFKDIGILNPALAMIFTPLTGIVSYFVAFVGPAAAIVAIKAIYGLAKDE